MCWYWDFGIRISNGFNVSHITPQSEISLQCALEAIYLSAKGWRDRVDRYTLRYRFPVGTVVWIVGDQSDPALVVVRTGFCYYKGTKQQSFETRQISPFNFANTIQFPDSLPSGRIALPGNNAAASTLQKKKSRVRPFFTTLCYNGGNEDYRHPQYAGNREPGKTETLVRSSRIHRVQVPTDKLMGYPTHQPSD